MPGRLKPCWAIAIQRHKDTNRYELFQVVIFRASWTADRPATHKCAIALTLGVYNLVRKHKTLGTTPAVAAGIEEKPWSLERVVEMTEAYWKPKYEAQREEKAILRRLAEDEVFQKAIG